MIRITIYNLCSLCVFLPPVQKTYDSRDFWERLGMERLTILRKGVTDPFVSSYRVVANEG